ncbi:AraC family transcriptional regulator [Nocardioides speluncae]|uniref:AraC family transcriptional regulator n=1 Tax=Nocardioides speluncae TaxID=2670337 RepID=UPI000D692DB1|nr:AraC family transcriptional regulator [Nocardioides speluncae]
MIRAASLRGFVALVRELGGDPEAYLGRFGIPASMLESADGLIPITEHDLMLDAAAAELDCRDFGLRLAESQDLTILGPLALAIESSATVAEALQCASRFMFIHSPALSVDVEPDPRRRRGVVALTYRKDLRESTYSPQAIELGVGLFHHVAAHLVGGTTGLRSVEFPHQPISPVSRYLDFFGVDVKFGSTTAALRVERQLLALRFAGADEAIRQIALDYLARHFPDPHSQLSAQVRRVLAESLGVVVPSLARSGRLLAMHPRTLQRRLAQEGTTHEAILDDVRREAAHRYITTTDLPLGQVAMLVGFSEQSALTHAVRRWHGTSPRELRARQRA